MKKCVGIVKGLQTKKGVPYNIVHYTEPFPSNNQKATGLQADTMFLVDSKMPIALSIGKDFEVTYTKGYDGQAYIDTVIVK